MNAVDEVSNMKSAYQRDVRLSCACALTTAVDKASQSSGAEAVMDIIQVAKEVVAYFRVGTINYLTTH